MPEAWAPSLAEVGARVPSKTRDQTEVGSDTLYATFNDKTVPTDSHAQTLVDGATALVAEAVGAIGSDLYDLATDAAAWRAAADIELAYPERPGDLAIYEELAERAKLALDRLISAADDTGTGVDATLPQWSMPDPVPWGDDYL